MPCRVSSTVGGLQNSVAIVVGGIAKTVVSVQSFAQSVGSNIPGEDAGAYLQVGVGVLQRSSRVSPNARIHLSQAYCTFPAHRVCSAGTFHKYEGCDHSYGKVAIHCGPSCDRGVLALHPFAVST